MAKYSLNEADIKSIIKKKLLQEVEAAAQDQASEQQPQQTQSQPAAKSKMPARVPQRPVRPDIGTQQVQQQRDNTAVRLPVPTQNVINKEKQALGQQDIVAKQNAAQQVASNAGQVAKAIAADPNNDVTPQQAQTAFQGLMGMLQNLEEGMRQFRENFNLFNILETVFGNSPLWQLIKFIFGDGSEDGQGYSSYGYHGKPAYKSIRGEIDAIVVHCTATEEGKDWKAKDIDSWHRQRGFKGIGYNYIIDLDGTIERGRPEGTVGAHCSNRGDSNLPYNSHSIGISYIGGVINSGKQRYDTKKGKMVTIWTPKDTRTPQQKAAMKQLITQLIQKYPAIKEVLGHREAGANKACPCFDASAEYSSLIPADRPMTPIREAGLKRGGGAPAKAPAQRKTSRSQAAQGLGGKTSVTGGGSR